ncbi:unnamed protein product [Triticum aestivum]|uniref:Integrase catalytic domain-containing protein n=1 Tax=Triticum aestivum TaxID=4565 RepID=A0A7H4LB30_WHEAT|nr:unnamed protein product [Triticum aestivum]
MHFDGSKMLAGLGVGVVLTSPTGDIVQYVLQILFTDSNNAVEYEALLHGLRMAVSMGIQRLEVRWDSNLAISRINGDFDAKDPKMAAYRNAVLKMSARFEGLEFHHVARESNQAADVLARISAKHDPVPPNIFLERLFKPSVVWQGGDSNDSPVPNTNIDSEHVDIIGGSATEITPSAHLIMAVIAPWTEPFLAYLDRKELPEDQNEACRIVRRSKAYKVHEGELYKKSTTGVLQRCISEEEGRQLLAEIHAGLGGHHAAARALVSKAFRTRFYWPTARADAHDLVQRYVGCQLFANQSHMPPTALRTIPITWPFAVWANLGIKLDYASLYHPQTNGQVERANGLIMSGIKPRLVRSLKESDKHWVEELDSVLWGLRTTPNRTTGYTPFFMVYGAEVVLPCDIIHDSPRVRMYEEKEAELDRQDSLDALEEERDVAKARSAFYQQQARRYQRREVRAKTYNVGELVLRLPKKKRTNSSPNGRVPS